MIKTIHGNSETELEKIESGSVDVILTDPPYLYLKNQKLDMPFDEQKIFSEFKRVLKPNGFVVMFGANRFTVGMSGLLIWVLSSKRKSFGTKAIVQVL